MAQYFHDLAWYWWLGLGLMGLGALVMAPLLFGRLFMPGLTLALFRRFGWMLSGLLDRISPGLDLRLMVRAGNRYFKKAFVSAPFHRRVLFLPFCLRPLDCPADVDPEVGLCCSGGCPDCEIGKIREEALALGYKAVYVVPSSRMMRGRGLMPSDEFIKAMLKKHRPQAALGVVCAWHVRNRLLAKNTLRHGKVASVQGAGDEATPRSALQGVLMDNTNCRRGKVDWSRVRLFMKLGSQGA